MEKNEDEFFLVCRFTWWKCFFLEEKMYEESVFVREECGREIGFVCVLRVDIMSFCFFCFLEALGSSWKK